MADIEFSCASFDWVQNYATSLTLLKVDAVIRNSPSSKMTRWRGNFQRAVVTWSQILNTQFHWQLMSQGINFAKQVLCNPNKKNERRPII